MTMQPHNLYRAADARELDRLAIEEYGIPGATLMERAGAAAFKALRERWPGARRIAVLCGSGNNGGDGFVVARLARQAGLEVEVYCVGDPSAARGGALQAMRRSGLEPRTLGAPRIEVDVVVDALLGTGLDREVTGEWCAAIEAINGAGCGVLAIDIPSGLDADNGRVLGHAVVADLTVTFLGLKRGLFTGQGPDCCGLVLFDGLGVPREIYSRVAPAGLRLSYQALAPLFVPRKRTAHKGSNGHVLVIGGDHGMGGAARLAGEAAGRVGAGLVSIATRAAHAPLLSAVRPELMSHGVETRGELQALLKRATVVAIGPGLGRSRWAREMLGAALETDRPLVVDADALNLLAQDPCRRDDWVLTPHPGEAARLLGVTAAEIQADRFRAAAELQRRYGGACVLKGAGSLICDADGSVGVCSDGNPGMASGGTGDVLTGVVAGLIAQGHRLADAASLGTCLHASAGDRAAAIGGQRGLLAADLMPHLRNLANPAPE